MLGKEVTFGGGAALASAYLHHRLSEDLDFFLRREIQPADLRPLTRWLSRRGIVVQQRQLGPRLSLVLVQAAEEIGRIDFAYFPYEPIARPTRWQGMAVDSLLDMAVNKVQAILTRFQPRDFVDVYFLLREGPESQLERLLDLVRAKFDVGADRLALAERLLLAGQIADLPRLLRPVGLDELRAFFEAQARTLVRKG